MDPQILTVSQEGQISLPASIRESLSIDKGDKLVAYTSGDAIMLKVLKFPDAGKFESLLDEAQKWAAEVGFKESDVPRVIKSVREKNRNEDSNSQRFL